MREKVKDLVRRMAARCDAREASADVPPAARVTPAAAPAQLQAS